MRATQAVHRLVVSVDTEGSSRRDLRGKLRMRETLHRIVEEALFAVGLQLKQVHCEDRGDGLLLALDPAVPPEDMVGLWLEHMYQGLREHNLGDQPARFLRLRIAMHAGPVADDGRGLAGAPVDLACGLCDHEVARSVLRAADRAHLVFVASDDLYRGVIREGGRFVEPEHYRPAALFIKGAEANAWLYVPRYSVPPLPGGHGGAPGSGGVPADRDAAPHQPPGRRPGQGSDRPGQGPEDRPGGPQRGAGPSGHPAPQPPAPAAPKYWIEQPNGNTQVFETSTFEAGSVAVNYEAAPRAGDGSSEEHVSPTPVAPVQRPGESAPPEDIDE